MKHFIDIDEILNSKIDLGFEKELAGSYGTDRDGNEQKQLLAVSSYNPDVDPTTGVDTLVCSIRFVVRDHGEVVHYGKDLIAAIKAYNAIKPRK